MRHIKLFLLLLLLFGNALVFHASALKLDQEDTKDEDTEDTQHTEDTHNTEDTHDGEHTGENEHEDSDHDGVDDETEAAYERQVNVDQSDREWKVESELKNGESKDKFKIEFKVGGGDEPEIKMEYATEAGSTDTEMKYRVQFDEIIEFNDNGAPGYNDANDTIVSSYQLDKQDWAPIDYSSEVVNGSTVYTAVVSTMDGVFALVLKLSTGFTQVNSTVITPNAIKVDVIINGYNYTGTGTYLTLKTDIKTEFQTEVDHESEDEQKGIASNETQVSFNSASASGFFSWVEFAEADGVQVDVISSTLAAAENPEDDLEEGESEQRLYFTFDAQQPDRIVWDPKVGINNDAFIASLINGLVGSDVITDPSILPFPMLTLLLAFAIPVIYRRRE